MNCNQIEPLLTAYLLGDLETTARQGVDEHLATCPACQAALAETRAALEPVQTALGTRGQQHFRLDYFYREKIRRSRTRTTLARSLLRIAAMVLIVFGVMSLFLFPAMQGSVKKAKVSSRANDMRIAAARHQEAEDMATVHFDVGTVRPETGKGTDDDLTKHKEFSTIASGGITMPAALPSLGVPAASPDMQEEPIVANRLSMDRKPFGESPRGDTITGPGGHDGTWGRLPGTTLKPNGKAQDVWFDGRRGSLEKSQPRPDPSKPSSPNESMKDWSVESYKLAMNGRPGAGEGGAGSGGEGTIIAGSLVDEVHRNGIERRDKLAKQSPPGVVREKAKLGLIGIVGDSKDMSSKWTDRAGIGKEPEKLPPAGAEPVTGFAPDITKSPLVMKNLYGGRSEGSRGRAIKSYGGAAPATEPVPPAPPPAVQTAPAVGNYSYNGAILSETPAAQPSITISAGRTHPGLPSPPRGSAETSRPPIQGGDQYSEIPSREGSVKRGGGKTEGDHELAPVPLAGDISLAGKLFRSEAPSAAKPVPPASGAEVQSQNTVDYYHFYNGDLRSAKPAGQPLEESQETEGGKKNGKNMINKMEKILIPEIEFRGANIADVVDFLNRAGQEGDKDGKEDETKGVKLTLAPEVEKTIIGSGTDPATSYGDEGAKTGLPKFGDITFNARFISMKQALDIITKVSGLKYRVGQNGITILRPEDEEVEVKQPEPVLSPQVFNPVIPTKQNAFSTFAIDVDTASFTIARRSLLSGLMPSPNAIRVEEFVNAFEYAYPPPERRAFAVYTDIAPSPFRAGLQLLRVGVRGKVIGRDRRRVSVLTFVIDTSGSMNMPDRLGLIKTALRLLVENLDDRDRVAIVTFGSEPRLVLDQTPALKKAEILQALDSIQTYGSTHLEGGLALGYETAARHFQSGAENRVLLLSDGVANLGAATAQELLNRVEAYRKQGIVCSVFGFGQGTYNDAMLETLADKGDGVYRFIDTPAEAQRVFVDDLAATLNIIARDVKIQVEFDPARVASYRLLGYENRALTKEQFRDDTVDAGEIGSGQSATALYELALAEGGGDAATPYRAAESALGMVRVRWADIDTGRVEELAHPVRITDRHPTFRDAPLRFRLAAGVAELAEVLRQSPYAAGTDKDDLLGVLRPIGLELVLDQKVQDLVRMANALGKK